MKSKTKIIALILIAILLASTAACGSDATSQNASVSPSQASESGPPSPNTSVSPSQASESIAPMQVIDMDRDGNSITLPESIDTIISMGPSNTEVLAALGFADRIIATDAYSDNIPGVDPSLAMFSMMAPDAEQIISMMPDVIFVTGMSMVGGDDPYRVVTDVGICVIYMPSSTSINGIKEDIQFMAAVLNVQERGAQLVSDMEREIERIRLIGETITEKKSVYFELAAAPFMYSLGQNTFLNEMIELIGAVNVFADQFEWLSVADEAVLDANPDVILTSVNYIDDPVGEILSRQGWGDVSAVSNNAVFYIDTDSSNRPSHNIVIALLQMTKAVYPDKY